jgi:hypothetical protein
MRTLLQYILFITFFAGFALQTPSVLGQKKTTKKSGQGTVLKKNNSKTKNKSKKTTRNLNSVKTKKQKLSNRKSNLEKIEKLALQDLVKKVPIEIPVLQDSTPSKVVTIMSAFKPQLKNVVKIDFTNASPISDTQSVSYSYQIPSQNLSFSYRPIALNPLAAVIPETPILEGNTRIKVGFGNYLYQFLEASYNKVSNNNIHDFNAFTESSEGAHHLQKFRDSKLNYLGNYALANQLHLTTHFYAQQTQLYRYGLVPDTIALPTDNYTQKSTHIGLQMALLNNNAFNKGIYFQPVLELENRSDIHSKNNTYFAISSPLSKQLKSGMLFNFDLHYSYSSYNNITSIQNSLLRWDPSLSFNKWNLKMKVGLSPVVKTDGFKLYPNIQLQHKLTDTTWDLQAGWISQTKNSNYSQLITENPWIISPAQLAISTQEKQFIKLVVNASKNVQYGFGISLNKYVNLALFNKTPNVVYDYIYPPSTTFYSNRVYRGLEYITIWEPNAHTIELEANLQYQWSDVFSIHNEFKYTQYNYIENNEKPWGLIPVQFNAGFYWKMNDKLLMDGSVQVMSGIQSTQEGSSFLAKTIPTAAIINAGISYKLSIPWKLWLKANNILNNTYQRWAEYPSLGVQINAGVVYSFHK